MPKNTKSRKGKKAWRKNISDSDVVAYKEKVDKEKRTGGDVTAIEDDALFFMDSKPNESQRPLRSERRAAALKTPLAVDRILSVKSAYKYPVVAAVNKTEPKGVHSIKRKTSEGKRKGGLPYDLWSAEDFNINTSDEQKKAVSLALGRSQATAPGRPIAGRKRLNAVPAVEVEVLGGSFNPPTGAHQELLAKAVADEYAKEYKKDTAKGTGEVIDLWKMDIGAMAEEEYLGTHGHRKDQDEEEDEDEDGEAAGDAEDAEDAQRLPGKAKPVVNKKLTQTDRNKLATKKERKRVELAAVALKKHRRDMGNMTEIQKELEEDEVSKVAERKRRAAVRKEKSESEPRRLGKRKFQPEPVQVQLTEEVTGSIRQLKGCPTLVRERFKSFQRRELIEPRVQQRSKRSFKFKNYEPGTKGDYEKASHHKLMDDIHMAKRDMGARDMAKRDMGKSML
mmetsp:Transcript_45367/g.75664  ORF Transcript_45367/g.75664 Transcript_45367/m.75664 type:complete len:450 (+) Transcript_45367:191-1540(+)|eukprot:CAMPEP_0198210258 /NCGR_PEP_ID=MMETSP1445-20131203/19992_1 /TAXON_ID=36898 /ORGANISM="Pyramimonas sp., Strain CCMP2087" /LENGTH=449 /DNA_ID=CAMNT_0043884275 /DNA_START=141 /DNA_END=1490 /DNA_ORIENTATION=-